MKIRIKGNSLRIRLSKSEVNQLAGEGYLEEQTSFSNNALVYALQTNVDAEQLSANFDNNKITMYVPEALTKGWPVNSIVGFDAMMPVADGSTLSLLLEKDFVCKDATKEDQCDNYENPGKIC